MTGLLRARSWPAKAAVLGLLATAVVIGVDGSPAGADEVYPLSAGTVLGIAGHGWGHGHGLSQYGAQGAAMRGIGSDQILSTYYPGTVSGTTDEGMIRVLIQDDEGADLQVAAAPGLAVRDNSTGARYVLPAGPARWRLYRAFDGLHVQGGDGVGWGGNWVPPGGPAAFAGAAQFDGPASERVFLPGGVSREYRGWMIAVPGAGTSISTVNGLPLEWYLYGVVPRESPSSFLPAALQAQAVAARTYSAYKRAHAGAAAWDICSSTQCQVYGGKTLFGANGSVSALEAASTNAAVDATAARVRLWNGLPAFTEFSATNGGWSTNGGTPYLAANPDPWDDNTANPLHSWTAGIDGTKVQAAYPQVGSLQRLRITSRDGNGDWGGRVTGLTLEGVGAGGAPTSATVSGDDFRIKLALRSTYWHANVTAIQAKYGALGGPTGLLGSALGGEVPAAGGGARSDYQNGSIYWSAATGAWEVHGAVRGLWAGTGAEAGFLGYPVTDEQGAGDGVGRFNSFQGGSVYWTPAGGAFEVHGAIAATWSAVGGVTGFLHYPVANEQATSDGAGRYGQFQGGSVYWTPATGAHEVHGGIERAWAALGSAAGLLGYPLSDETGTPDGVGRLNAFQRGAVYWTPATGAHEVHGAIRGSWSASGAQAGPMGYPVSDEYAVPGGARSDFEHGWVSWDAATGVTTRTLR
ncbi:MAG: SpoIID/LytB domain-containing protein [Actinomycetota bacterium]|nr:SpoIID/LytB domain-containing protein [Actinomycetota bacterium]